VTLPIFESLIVIFVTATLTLRLLNDQLQSRRDAINITSLKFNLTPKKDDITGQQKVQQQILAAGLIVWLFQRPINTVGMILISQQNQIDSPQRSEILIKKANCNICQDEAPLRLLNGQSIPKGWHQYN